MLYDSFEVQIVMVWHDSMMTVYIRVLCTVRPGHLLTVYDQVAQIFMRSPIIEITSIYKSLKTIGIGIRPATEDFR